MNDGMMELLDKLRATGATQINLETEEIGDKQYVNKVSVVYPAPPQVKLKVEEEPLPDDPELRRQEVNRRQDAIDFHSS